MSDNSEFKNHEYKCMHTFTNENIGYTVHGIEYNRVIVFPSNGHPFILNSDYYFDPNYPKNIYSVRCVTAYTDPKTGKVYIVGGSFNVILVWDLDEKKLVNKINADDGRVTAVCTFTVPKTGKVYIVSGSEDSYVRVWDASNGECVTRLGDVQNVNSLCTFTDPKEIVYIVSGEKNFNSSVTINVWNALDGTLVKEISTIPDSVLSVSTFTDAKTQEVYVVSTSDNDIKIWNALDDNDGVVNTLNGHTHKVTTVSTFTDAKTQKVYVVSGSWDKTIRVWDALDGTLVNTLSGHTSDVVAVSTITHATTQKVYVVSWSKDHTIKVWDPFN